MENCHVKDEKNVTVTINSLSSCVFLRFCFFVFFMVLFTGRLICGAYLGSLSMGGLSGRLICGVCISELLQSFESNSF